MYDREKIYLTVCFFFAVHICSAQTLSLIKSFIVPDIQRISHDINNSFYIADHQGNILQYDSTGTAVNHYSPQIPSEVTLIDASKTMSIFVFYRELQQFQILNRFLATPSYNKINRDFIGYAYMAGPSLDNNLWIFDNFTFSLKKYDLNLQKVIIETPLDLILDSKTYNINQIKEYQNKVYFNNFQNGILVFDNLGNPGISLPFKTNYFNFMDEELYFIQNGELIFYNLYSQEIRKITSSQITDANFALAFNKKIILFYDRRISIFKLN